MKPSISVFFPCFNDQKSIGKLVKDAFSTLNTITKNFEVIVVDDKSTDQSRQALQKLALKYPLRLIFHKKNLGYGGALQSGLKNAQKKLIFYTDGDGQYDVKELPILLGLMSPDVDFVNGIKMSRKDPTYRILLGNLYSFLTRWFFWLPILDVDCDFRLIRKSIVRRLNLKCKSGAICVELVKKSQKAGANFRQVSIHHFERKWGNSQFFIPRRIFSTLLELTKLWFTLILQK